MENFTIVPTYRETDYDGMVQTGYFLASNRMPLHWVALENVIKVYGECGYTQEYIKTLVESEKTK